MPITSADRQLIVNDAIDRLTVDGLYIPSIQSKIQYFRNTFPVNISASPFQTSGTHSALDVIFDDLIGAITDYYSTSAISISAFGLSVENGISAVGTKLGINYNYQNLKINSLGQLDTIQNLFVSASPTFSTINLTNLSNGLVVILSGGKLITSAINYNFHSNGIVGYIPKFNDLHSITNSLLYDNGSYILVNGSLSASTNTFLNTLNVSGSIISNSFIGSGNRYIGVDSTGLFTIMGNVSASISGSVNNIPKFVTTTSIGNSIMSDNGTSISVIGNSVVFGSISATGTLSINSLSGASTRILVITSLGNVAATPIPLNGTIGNIAKFDSTTSVANAIMVDNGSVISIQGGLSASSTLDVISLSGTVGRIALIDPSGRFQIGPTSASILTTTNLTTGRIPKSSGLNSLVDSIQIDNGSTITILGGLSATGNFNLISLSGATTRVLVITSTGLVTQTAIPLAGTIGNLAKFDSSSSVANSIMLDNGSVITIPGGLSATGNLDIMSLSGTVGRIALIDPSGRFQVGPTSGSILTTTNLTTGQLPKASGLNSLVNSIINDNGSTITIQGGLSAVGTFNLLSLSGATTRVLVATSTGLITTTTIPLNGTIGNIAKFDSTASVANSIMLDNGSKITIPGGLSATGNLNVLSLSGTTTRFATIDSTGLFGSSLAISNFVSGSGTAGKIVKWSTSNGLTDSLLSESGSLITLNGSEIINTNLNVSGTATIDSSVVLNSTLQLINGLFSGRKGLFDSDFTLGTSPLVVSGAMVYNAGAGVLTFSPTSYIITSSLNVSGKCAFSNTTDATTSTNASVIFAGGLGVSKSVWSASYFLSELTAKNSFVINSTGANFGFLSNPSSNTWSLSYGTTIGTLGTPVLAWNSSNNLFVYDGSSNIFLTTSGSAKSVGIGSAEIPFTTLDIRGDGTQGPYAFFGGKRADDSSYPGSIYFAAVNQINTGYNANSDDYNLLINYSGYQNGTSNSRQVQICDGKHNSLAVFRGSTGFTRIGKSTNIPNHSLDVQGSFGGKQTRTNIDLTLDSTHHTIICTNTTTDITITLPAVTACPERHYYLFVGSPNNAGHVVNVQGNGADSVNADGPGYGFWSPWTATGLNRSGFILVADATGGCWRVVGG